MKKQKKEKKTKKTDNGSPGYDTANLFLLSFLSVSFLLLFVFLLLWAFRNKLVIFRWIHICQATKKRKNDKKRKEKRRKKRFTMGNEKKKGSGVMTHFTLFLFLLSFSSPPLDFHLFWLFSLAAPFLFSFFFFG